MVPFPPRPPWNPDKMLASAGVCLLPPAGRKQQTLGPCSFWRRPTSQSPLRASGGPASAAHAIRERGGRRAGRWDGAGTRSGRGEVGLAGTVQEKQMGVTWAKWGTGAAGPQAYVWSGPDAVSQRGAVTGDR